jgi:SAM-dependent methyltransferase
LKYTYLAPPLPSFARWRAIYANESGLSCLRALEYERLRQLRLEGRVLDVGGGRRARYRKLLPQDLDYESVNIDPQIEPTYLVGPGERFPIADASYDICLSLNTLEHVYDARFLLDEMHRVLAPGGAAYLTVPFIFRIHGHPDDYFRGTPSWWRESLLRSGFAEVELQPLVWGRYTSAGSVRGYRGVLTRAQFHISHFTDILYAKAYLPFGEFSDGRYSGRRGERICGVALGYFITARKLAP